MGFRSPGADDAATALASYLIVSDGTTVTGYDHTGAVVASGADGGAVLTAVFAAIPAAGANIEFRNDGLVFPWSSVPLLPKSVTGMLQLEGNMAHIRLSAGGPTFLGFNRAADYDTFKNILIDGFLVDRNNVATASGAPVVIGNNSTTAERRLNFQNITIRNIQTMNVPTLADPSNANHSIRVISYHLGQGETQTNIKQITVQDCNLQGGDYGVLIAGFVVAGTGCEVYLDAITVDNVYHDTLAINNSGVLHNSVNVMIGGQGFGNTATVRDCTGVNAGDVAYEIDAMQLARVDNCKSVNPYDVGILGRNYHAAIDANQQRYIITGHDVRLTSAWTPRTNFIAYKANSPGAAAFGSFLCYGCSFNSLAAVDLSGWSGLAFDAESSIARIVLHDYSVTLDSVADTTGGTPTNNLITIFPVSDCYVEITRLRQRVNGSTTNATTFLRGMIMAANNTSNEVTFAIDDWSYDLAVTGMGNSKTNMVRLGDGTGIMRGSLEKLKVLAWSADTTPSPIRIVSTGTLTIDGRITIRDCDFTKCPAGTSDFGGIDATQRGQVFTQNNVWRTTPVPTTLTGLASATGKVLATMWPAMVTFVQGSGTAVTAIDYSTNGGTTYTNYLTQVGAVLPAGFDQSLGPLTTDSLIKVTFGVGTQPTINLVPVNP